MSEPHSDAPERQLVPSPRVDGEPLRLMCVHAHPDDESSKGAAVMAKYLAEGARVLVVTCTGGERGDILNPALKDDPEVLRDITEVRRKEMAEAIEILGVEHTWLGFVDSGLPEGDPLPPLPEGCFALEPLDITTEALVGVIRDFKPHVMTTYDELGGYPHPDHIMTQVVSMAAFDAAGDPDAFPHTGPAWQPSKIYYNQTFTLEKMTFINEAIRAKTGEAPFEEWLERMRQAPARPPYHARIDVGDFLEVRDRALLAHRTQIDPNGHFFSIPVEEQKTLWPWEDYELGRSLIESERVEDDLFAGLR